MNEERIINEKLFTSECNRLLDEYDSLPKDSDISTWLSSQAENEDERIVIEDMCNEVKTFQQKMKDWILSKQSISKWFEHEIETIIKVIFPNITSAEMSDFKDQIDKSMDQSIEIETICLEQETKDVSQELTKGGNI